MLCPPGSGHHVRLAHGRSFGTSWRLRHVDRRTTRPSVHPSGERRPACGGCARRGGDTGTVSAIDGVRLVFRESSLNSGRPSNWERSDGCSRGPGTRSGCPGSTAAQRMWCACTPVLTCPALSEQAGCELFLKCENLHSCRSVQISRCKPCRGCPQRRGSRPRRGDPFFGQPRGGPCSGRQQRARHSVPCRGASRHHQTHKVEAMTHAGAQLHWCDDNQAAREAACGASVCPDGRTNWCTL